VWSSGPDYQGNGITITVTFNDSTKALTGATIVRDPGCVWQTIFFGVGADGTPNSTTGQFGPIAAGTTTESAHRLKQGGFNTINDILPLQITAG
jgi:hypothetical protein